jgi:hypothetical protein
MLPLLFEHLSVPPAMIRNAFLPDTRIPLDENGKNVLKSISRFPETVRERFRDPAVGKGDGGCGRAVPI